MQKKTQFCLRSPPSYNIFAARSSFCLRFVLLWHTFKFPIIMNKTELIAAVAAQANLTKDQAKAAVEAVLQSIADTLKEEKKVAILGFGTFSVNERPAREGINPATKEKIQIPAKKVVKFKAGAQLEVK